jgi:tetratricopeptide (TPR) repeat protein
MQAVAAKDYPTAFGLFETLVNAEPDNLRYASEYRQAAIQAKQFDRSISFFEKLVVKHPDSGHAFLNLGFAYVDKMPASGTMTQLILANNALTQFSKAVVLQPEWISYYTRGNSYLFWPRVFNRTQLGIADLEKAMKLQKHGPRQGYYVRTYIALGDGFWKMNKLSRARSIWRKGLKEFPDNGQLQSRLASQGDKLKEVIEDSLDPGKRIDTSLRELWADQ